MITRKGMWIVFNNTIGILHEIKPDAEFGEVHLVDEKGETVEAVTCRISELRQAKIAEIPAARIKGMKAAVLNKLGYK